MKTVSKLSILAPLLFLAGCSRPESGASQKEGPPPSKVIARSGKLADQRSYELRASFPPQGATVPGQGATVPNPGATTPVQIEELTIRISGQPVSLPEEAWRTLRVKPEETSFGVSDFAGEATLRIASEFQSRPAAILLKIRDQRVVEREIVVPGEEPVVERYRPPIEFIHATIPPEELARLRAEDAAHAPAQTSQN
jgi:hypothetical protein